MAKRENDLTPDELEGLWNYLYTRAETYRLQNDLQSAKALLQYLIRQPSVKKQLRKEVHHFLAIISYGPTRNIPKSHSRLQIRSARLRVLDFAKKTGEVVMRPVKWVRGQEKEEKNTPSPEEVVEFYNEVRRERVRSGIGFVRVEGREGDEREVVF